MPIQHFQTNHIKEKAFHDSPCQLEIGIQLCWESALLSRIHYTWPFLSHTNFSVVNFEQWVGWNSCMRDDKAARWCVFRFRIHHPANWSIYLVDKSLTIYVPCYHQHPFHYALQCIWRVGHRSTSTTLSTSSLVKLRVCSNLWLNILLLQRHGLVPARVNWIKLIFMH